ncbi:TPA: hypothetical protein ACVO37_001661 [Vibrio alginolyticus]
MISKIFLWQLKRVAKKATTGKVARSGEEAKEVDLYSIRMSNEEGRYLVQSIHDDKIYALKLNKQATKFEEEVQLDLDSFDKYDYDFMHYYGTVNIGYESRNDFLLNELTYLYVLRAKWSSSKYLVPAWWWRRKKLPMPTREMVLEAIIDLSERKGIRQFEKMELLYEIYTAKVLHNRKSRDISNRLDLVLASLKESKELRVLGHNQHLINGQALATYERLLEERARAAEENAREKRSRRQSSAMLWLTVVLAITAAFQSGLIETSYSFDLDKHLKMLSEAIVKWISFR